MKKYLLPVLDGGVCAVVFTLTAYLGAGIASIMSILIFCAVFGGYLLFRISGYDKISLFTIFIVSDIIFILLTNIFCYRSGLFYSIFTSINDYGAPNAGTGFGMVISLLINCAECVVMTVVKYVKITESVMIQEKGKR